MDGDLALFHTTPTWFEKAGSPCMTEIALLPYSLKTDGPSVAKNYDFVSADWVTGDIDMNY